MSNSILALHPTKQTLPNGILPTAARPYVTAPIFFNPKKVPGCISHLLNLNKSPRTYTLKHFTAVIFVYLNKLEGLQISVTCIWGQAWDPTIKVEFLKEATLVSSSLQPCLQVLDKGESD